jgi:peptide/nickel transport system ATP-binding protein
MNNPLLQVSNLSIEYHSHAGNTPVLNNISFSLPEGHILCIAGESGSGKTSLALAIMKLISSQNADIQGSIFFWMDENNSIDLVAVPESAMESIRGKRISMIFQEIRSAFNPLFTCGNQIAETIRKVEKISEADARSKAKDWLKKTELEQPERIFRSYPHELSGGQLQRAMIAMALCCRPALLIADEPLASSDFSNYQSLLRLFKSFVSESGMAMILISHDLSAMEQVADSVLILHQGKVLEHGPTARVMNTPEHEYTKKLLGSSMGKAGMMAVKMKKVSAGSEENPQAGIPVLKVCHLYKSFKSKNRFTGKVINETKAVWDCSFELYKGETIGITGNSGSGKTTLARCLCGLLEADSGEIFFKGERIFPAEGKKKNLNGKIQIVFQHPDASLNPKITLGESVMEPLRYYGMLNGREALRNHALHLMELAGLDSKLFYSYPHQLSGGQKQRGALIRALATQPEILICDEAVSALDSIIRLQVLQLLNELKSIFGFSMIFISHDWPVVKSISDKILVFHQGSIMQNGNPDSLWIPRSEQAAC